MSKEFIILDTETTGLKKENEDLLEFAGVKFKGDQEVDRFQIYIKPHLKKDFKVNPTKTITKEMIDKDGIELKEAMTKIKEWIGNDNIVLVAHSSPFDKGFINENLKRCNMSELENRWVDSVWVLKRAFKKYGYEGSVKMDTLVDIFNINVEGKLHNALDDVLVLINILRKVKERLDREKDNFTNYIY